MAYTLEQIEYLHERGLMPDWVYYQQNGKTAEENFRDQRKRLLERCEQREQERRREQAKKEEKQLEAEMEKQLEKAIEKALDQLLKDFNK